MQWRALVFLLLVLLLPGCARKKRAGVPVPRPVGSTETGIASWYGHPYHGRAAANGEIYDMEKLTAAHRTLPFGTWVEVRNLTNEKSVKVRITDRGPFVDGRIIDLSRAAAREIDLIGPGIVKVRLEVIDPPRGALPERYAVQVGAFRDQGRAERLRREMERQYGFAKVVIRQGRGPVHRVLVGNELTHQAAGLLAEQLRGRVEHTFIVRLDP
jgi:rare lipoprotein A